MTPKYYCFTVLSGVGTRAGVLAMPDTGSSEAELVGDVAGGLGKNTQTGVLTSLGTDDSGAGLVGELKGGLGKSTQTGVLTSLGVLMTQRQIWFVSWKGA